MDFRIIATAEDETISHPVKRAANTCQPVLLLVGTDTSDREQTLHRFAVTAWAGLTSLLVLALDGDTRDASRRVCSFAAT